VLDFDDAPVPASLQELADATAEPEEPKDETSFHTLLLELDDMEQGIKTDFDDLLRDGAAEPDAQVSVEVEPEPEDDILGVAEAREKLLAAVAALEQPPLSDEEDEARALAEATRERTPPVRRLTHSNVEPGASPVGGKTNDLALID